MNLLAHPLYALLALGACAWLSVANHRGITPFDWGPGSGTAYRGTSFGHGFSHMSHK